MKTFFRCMCLLVAWILFGTSVFAESDASLEKLGVVRGRVVDGHKHVLPGAAIYIDGIHSGTISNIDGFYTLSNLNPGKYVMKVSYVGYSPIEVNVEVSEGKTTQLDIVLEEGIELDEVVVKGSALRGQRRALNAQKTGMGITNVVSADQVSKFPDANIGDALKRISGINVQYDQGEARFGQVRGTSADMSSVTVNGSRLPSAEGDVRNVQLDLIPADMVQTIEVNKVVTSDMEGDAIGGSINLITKSTPYKRSFTATAGSGYNMVSNKAQLNLGASYGDRFFKNKLGLMAAASYQLAPAGSDDVEFEYDIDDDDNVVMTDAETRQYYVTRQRQSYSLALDYDINENNKIMLKGLYNRRHDWENRYRISYKDLDKEGENEVEIETKGGANARNARLELQQTMDFSLSGEHLLGKLEMDWDASYARASEDRPDERYFKLKQKDVSLNVVDPGTRFPYVTNQINLGEGEWKLDEVTNSNQSITEQDAKVRVDFKLPLAQGRFSNVLKFGAKHVTKFKEKNIVAYDYTDAYEEAYGEEYMEHLSTQVRDGYMPGSNYNKADFVTNSYMGGLDLDALEGEQILEESSGNYNAQENVSAAYLRFDQNFGKKHQLVVGLRMEATYLEYEGFNWNIDADENESLVPTGKKNNFYVNWLPSILYKYDISRNLKLRASFTETLARPKYSALVPSVNINLTDMEIYEGNPDLKPALSYNADLSLEYYFESIGLVSGGVFYKRINDFIVDQRTSGEYGDFKEETGEPMRFKEIVKTVNAGNADLLGVEVALQRDFGFIAPALKCLGVYGNYTYTYSRVRNFNFEGRENEQNLSLPGSPAHSANASLYFEMAGFNLRVSYNYASSFIDEMGKDARLDRYYDAVNYLDVNASYTFGKKVKWSIYAEATNLLNQPLRYYQGTKDRTMQAEYYGIRCNAGVKMSF